MAGEKHQAVVIDNGTYRIRAGLAGEDEPAVSFPNVIGRPTDGAGGEFIGRNTQTKLDVLNTKSPIENGLVTNWDDMEKIWNYTYSDELKMNSADLPLLITERPQTPKENKEKMAQILFEKFKVPGLFCGIQGVLSLYASGRLTGLVIDSGEEMTHAVPVFSGYAIPEGVMGVEMGGKHVTQCLKNLLNASGQNFTSPSDLDVVRQIKESVCDVASDYEAAAKKSEAELTKTFKLPDGKDLTLTREAYECTELLFKPAKCGLSGPGILDLVQQSAAKCELDARKELLANTMLAGGNTMFGSLKERFKNDLSAAVKTPVKVVAPNERNNSVWIGASVLSNLATFKDITVTKKEYEEAGPAAIHKKF